MDGIYSKLVSRYYVIHITFCCIVLLTLIVVGYIRIFNTSTVEFIQRACHPILMSCFILLLSALHAMCLWVLVRHMPGFLKQYVQQQDVNEYNCRVFGLTNRHIYTRYITDLCFYNAFLLGIVFLILAPV